MKNEVVSRHRGREIPTGRSAVENGEGGNSRLNALLDGAMSVEDLDDDECRFGITKDDDGKFAHNAARKSSTLPNHLQKQIQQELFQRANARMRAGLLPAIESLVDIATNEAYDPKDRIKAGQYIVERNQGKTPEVVVHSQDKPWEVVYEGVETTTREEARAKRIETGNIVEGDIVDEDE